MALLTGAVTGALSVAECSVLALRSGLRPLKELGDWSRADRRRQLERRLEQNLEYGDRVIPL